MPKMALLLLQLQRAKDSSSWHTMLLVETNHQPEVIKPTYQCPFHMFTMASVLSTVRRRIFAFKIDHEGQKFSKSPHFLEVEWSVIFT